MQYPMDFWLSGLNSEEVTRPTHSGLPMVYLRGIENSEVIDTGLDSSDPGEYALGTLMGIVYKTDNLPPQSEVVPIIADELHQHFGLPMVKSKETAMEAYRVAEAYVLGPQFRRN